MTEDKKREIIDYAAPPFSVMIVGIVFVVLSPLVYFIVSIFARQRMTPIIAGSVTAVMGFVFFMLRFYYESAARSAINHAEKTAGGEFLAYDFRSGNRYLNGRLICGEHYIFSKGVGAILRLSEIDKIIRVTTYYKNVPTAENLVAKMKNGKKVTIISISQIEYGHPPYADVIENIRRYAPDIEFVDKR